MKKLFLGASVLSISQIVSSAGLVIDDFSDSGDPSGFTNLFVFSALPTATAFGQGLNGVVGDRRQTTLQAQPTSAPSPNFTSILISDIPPPTFVFNGSDNSNAKITLGYGSAINSGPSDTGNPADSVPLNFDVTGGGFTGLNLNVAGFDSGSANLPLNGFITLFSNGVEQSSVSIPFTGAPGTGAGTLTFDFGTPSFDSFDLTDVDGFQIDVDGAEGTDFSLSSIELVNLASLPEPSSALALSLLLGSNIFARRRRRS